MMWWGDGTGGWLGMGFMMLFGTVFTIGLIALVVWLVMAAARGGGGMMGGGMTGGGGMRGDAAIEEARRRYARGEITREEYEEISRTLGR